MEIVRTVKRIDALNKAIKRVPDSEKYDAVWDALYDKKEALIALLKTWANGAEKRKEIIRRWRNIRLACNLLKMDYYNIIRV
jgi:hypothetical protein